MALRIKLFIGLVRPQKIRPPHGSATKDSTPPTPDPAESRSQADRIKEFFMRRGAAEQHGKLFGNNVDIWNESVNGPWRTTYNRAPTRFVVYVLD